MQLALHTTSRTAIERAAQAAADAKLAAKMGLLEGSEALEELTFQQLLDLRDECSDSGDWDALSDIDRELGDRRDDGRTALERTFVAAMEANGTVPMAEGGEVAQWAASRYLGEALATDAGVTLAAKLLLYPSTRAGTIRALANEYAREQSEDLLCAGWTE